MSLCSIEEGEIRKHISRKKISFSILLKKNYVQFVSIQEKFCSICSICMMTKNLPSTKLVWNRVFKLDLNMIRVSCLAKQVSKL